MLSCWVLLESCLSPVEFCRLLGLGNANSIDGQSKHNWYRNQFKNPSKTKNSKCCENENNVVIGRHRKHGSIWPQAFQQCARTARHFATSPTPNPKCVCVRVCVMCVAVRATQSTRGKKSLQILAPNAIETRAKPRRCCHNCCCCTQTCPKRQDTIKNWNCV